jgi:hypothetical protein
MTVCQLFVLWPTYLLVTDFKLEIFGRVDLDIAVLIVMDLDLGRTLELRRTLLDRPDRAPTPVPLHKERQYFQYNWGALKM